jgi:hypothetical protein
MSLLKRLGLAALVTALSINAEAGLFGLGGKKKPSKPTATKSVDVSTNYGVSVVSCDNIKTSTLEGVVIGGTPYVVIPNQLGKTAATNELPFELVETKDLTGVYDLDKRTYSQSFNHTLVPQLERYPDSTNLYTEIELRADGLNGVRAEMPDFSSATNIGVGSWSAKRSPSFGINAIKINGESYFTPLTADGRSRYLLPVKNTKVNVSPK